MNRLINHVIFLIDASGSMARHSHKVPALVQSFKDKIKNENQTDQQTLISTFSFSDSLKKLSLEKPISDTTPFNYVASGNTAFRDSLGVVINEFIKIQAKSSSVRDEDHAFLLYFITDGADNASRVFSSDSINNLISKDLNDRWTVAGLVPDLTAVHKTKLCGIPTGNIEVWDISSEYAIETVSDTIFDSYKGYSALRSSGITNSSKMFKVTENAKSSSVDPVQSNSKSGIKVVQGILAHSQKQRNAYDFATTLSGFNGTQLNKVFVEHKNVALNYSNYVLIDKSSGKKYQGNSISDLKDFINYNSLYSITDFVESAACKYRLFFPLSNKSDEMPARSSIFILE